MKSTLNELLRSELKSIETRIEMLEKHIREYTKANNLMDAAINKIKLDTLTMVHARLSDILERA